MSSAATSKNASIAARAREVETRLERAYPDATCALHHDSPYQLLIATVLSAQTTDARVNTVTPALFARYPTPGALAAADVGEVEALVRPLGFHHRRAAALVGIGRALVEKHQGEVPADRAGLVALPGVGRKTANVVLGNVFGTPAITVDTHVGRLSRRLGLTDHTDPVRVERDLAGLLTESGDRINYTVTCHRLIEHGRRVCHARTPACGECVLADLCPSARAA